MMTSHLSSYVCGGCWFISGSSSRIQHSCEDSARMAQTCVCLCSDQCVRSAASVASDCEKAATSSSSVNTHGPSVTDETQTMFHIVESCPLTKLNGGLSRLRSGDEDSVSWLTSYVS